MHQENTTSYTYKNVIIDPGNQVLPKGIEGRKIKRKIQRLLRKYKNVFQ